MPALVAISVGRLIFEPGWVPYHVAPLVIALVLWELRDATWRLPLLSTAAMALLVESPRLGLPAVGWLRLVGVAGICVALFLASRRRLEPTSLAQRLVTTPKVGSTPRLTQ